jgi:signal transduction histidine kinase
MNSNKTQSITSYARQRAVRLSIKIFIIGVTSTFLIGLGIGAYYYQGQLSNTLSVVSKSLGQPMALGGDYLPSQITKTLIDSGNYKDVWLQRGNGDLHIEKHFYSTFPQFNDIKNKRYYWNNSTPFIVVSKSIHYHGERVGRIYLGYRIPFGTLVGFALATCLLFSVIALYLYKHILKLARGIAVPFKDYSEKLDGSNNKEEFLRSKERDHGYTEIKVFDSIMLDYIEKNKVSELLARKAISKAQIAKVASRVKHDVIASLVIGESALERVDKDKSQLSILKSMFERISNTVEDIPKLGELTDDEMKSAISGEDKSEPTKDELRSSHLCAYIYQIVGEIKLSKFCQDKDIKFDIDCDEEGFSAFSEIQTNKLKRNLINLLKNSIEAIETQGSIKVIVRADESTVSISIKDDGKGIPKDKLDLVGTRGQTFGKENGSGIGLSSSIEDIHYWGGSLLIDSEEGQGTSLEIKLPRSEDNEIFPTSLTLIPETTIVIVDDDPLVHKLWRRRLQKVNSKKSSIDLFFARNIKAARSQLSKLEAEGKEYTLFIDNDLKDSKTTGADLVKELKIESKSILVSSSGNSGWLYEKCAALHLPIIPKSIQEVIPIEICN